MFFVWINSGDSGFTKWVKIKNRLAPLVAACIAVLSGTPNANAELPMLDQKPWLGYYAVFANKRYCFRVLPTGDIDLSPMNEKGGLLGKQLAINIYPGIEETMPDGKTVMRQTKAKSLESKEAPTENLGKTTIRGKVTGDAEYELYIEQVRGIIFMGGRVLNAGSLTKNPIRFVVRLRIPNAYPYQENQADIPDDRKQNRKADLAEKAFQKKVRNDSLTVKWLDGKRVKQDYEKIVDVNSKELNGPGIASAEIDVGSYKGRRLLFTAAPNSAMKLQNSKAAPLHEGFTVIWAADMAKDPEAKARLAMEVK